MNLTRSSRYALVVLLVLALTLGAAGTALAVSFDDSDVPDAVEVGEQEEIAVTMNDPFDGQPDSWTVSAESSLDDVTVIIEAETVGGDTITEQNSMTIDSDDGINRVTIRASGVVPEIASYDYEDRDAENVLAIEVSDDNAIMGSWEVHRYTSDSQAAREAIDEAREVVEDSNSDSAADTLDDAIAFYNNGEFDRAINSAENAQETAESEGETMQLLLMVGGILAVAAIVVGGVYFWKSRQQDTHKLQ